MKLAMAETWRSCWNDQQGEEQSYSNGRDSKAFPLDWKTRAYGIPNSDDLMPHH
jgi:hypothetical protein